MIVESVAVRNFRAVRDAELNLGRLTYLIGRNGAGKSTLLNAMAAFFRLEKVTEADRTAGILDQTIEISVTFAELEPAAATEFAKYVRGDRLKVTLRAEFEDGRLKESYHGVAPAHPEFSDLRRLTGQVRINAYRELQDRLGLPAVRSASDVDIAIESWEADRPLELQLVEDDGQFFGFTNVGAGKLNKYVTFVMVPAIRDAASDAIETRDNTLRLLVNAIVRRSPEAGRPIADLRNRIALEYADLLARPEMSLAPLTDEVTAAIGRFAPGSSVDFSWAPLVDTRLPDPSVLAKLTDDGLEGDVQSKGHGLQRAYVMALIQALADVERRRVVEDDDERTAPGLVLAVEEPELFQHPAQARQIARTFQSLADEAGAVQVVACTHSPMFVSVDSFPSVRIIRKRRIADGTQVTTIGQATLDVIAERLEVGHADGRARTGRGLEPGLVSLLNPYVNEAFFADFVVLVEGEEDKAWLEASLEEYRVDWQNFGTATAIVPAGGKKNLDKLVAILDALGIETYVVFDRDGEDGEPNAQVAVWNQALQRLVGIADPQEMPGTSANERHAVFSPDMTSVLKTELGLDSWERRREAACLARGIEVRRGVEKNPAIARDMLALSRDAGDESASLIACARAIARAIQGPEEGGDNEA